MKTPQGTFKLNSKEAEWSKDIETNPGGAPQTENNGEKVIRHFDIDTFSDSELRNSH